MKAATSEPRKFSPSPRPTTSGELRRAPTTMSGCVGVGDDQRERALEPAAHRADGVGEVWRPLPARRPAGGRRPRCRCRDSSSCPAASSSARRAAKFSMMPLWTTATPAGEVRVGVAVVGRAVRGPAGVTDAGVRDGQRLLVERVDEVGQLAGSLGGREDVAISRRQPGRRRRSRIRGTRGAGDPPSRRRAQIDDRRTRRFRTWVKGSGGTGADPGPAG